MIQKIIKWPGDTALLHQMSAAVSFVRDSTLIDELVRDMQDTMYDVGGIGLSAIQIGVPLRVVIMDVHDKDYVFINPALKLSGKKVAMTEGCLSLPGIIELVDRHPTAEVTALDRNGEPIVLKFTGLEAQCLQHEVDHIDGKIIPDYLSDVKRTRISAQLKKP